MDYGSWNVEEWLSKNSRKEKRAIGFSSEFKTRRGRPKAISGTLKHKLKIQNSEDLPNISKTTL